MFFKQKFQVAISIFVIVFIMFSLCAIGALAQIIPGSDAPPFSGGENTDEQGANEIDSILSQGDSVAVVNELRAARDVLWDTILGEEDAGPLADVLDNVRVLVSGVMNIGGRDALYVGVDEDDWGDDTKRNNIKSALQSEFPDVVVIVEGTAGIQRFVDADTVGAIPLVYNISPSLLIPDNGDSQSSVSTISVSNNVTVGGSVSVAVDITHTFIGDLKVDLVAPNGVVFDLHSGSGGSDDNINKTYTVESSSLQGISARGSWKLRVGDYASGDIGTLNSWGLTITPGVTLPELPSPVASPLNPIFSDDFQSGLGRWTAASGSSGIGWRTKTQGEGHTISGYAGDNTDGNIVAESGMCGGFCTLTLSSPIDMTSHTSATLSFNRLLDTDLDSGEYLKVEVGNGGTYREIFKWTSENGDDDDVWHYESYTLTSADLASTGFTVRFTSNQNTLSEEVGIDDVVISREVVSPSQRSYCYGGPDRDIPMGGDRATVRSVKSAKLKKCGTITLGGVETKDGKKGFVMSAHVVDRESYEDTNVLIGHKISSNGRFVRHPLGKVDDMPFKWALWELFSSFTTRKHVVFADSAFVEYPHAGTRGCRVEWREDGGRYCFQYEYLDRVESMKVRGGNTTYTVIGSQSPEANLPVRLYGAATRAEIRGSVDFGGVSSVAGEGKVLSSVKNEDGSVNKFIYLYRIGNLSKIAGPGDSGAPVYTEPNAENEVNMVGIVYGGTKMIGQKGFVFFSSWEDVEETLSLKPLQ